MRGQVHSNSSVQGRTVACQLLLLGRFQISLVITTLFPSRILSTKTKTVWISPFCYGQLNLEVMVVLSFAILSLSFFLLPLDFFFVLYSKTSQVIRVFWARENYLKKKKIKQSAAYAIFLTRTHIMCKQSGLLFFFLSQM